MGAQFVREGVRPRIFNAHFIVLNAKSIVLNAKFIVFNTKFIVSDTKFSCFYQIRAVFSRTFPRDM